MRALVEQQYPTYASILDCLPLVEQQYPTYASILDHLPVTGGSTLVAKGIGKGLTVGNRKALF
jgi:hypothetical protein